jgi:hypothetical protein
MSSFVAWKHSRRKRNSNLPQINAHGIYLSVLAAGSFRVWTETDMNANVTGTVIYFIIY